MEHTNREIRQAIITLCDALCRHTSYVDSGTASLRGSQDKLNRIHCDFQRIDKRSNQLIGT